MSVGGFFKNLWGKLWPTFRHGLEGFLSNELENALRIARAMLTDFAAGKYVNTDAFARALWTRLRAEYTDAPGTWLTLLANFAIDALKNRGVL